MSKKTLLNEAAVRRFMKLADMGTLSDNFINEMGMAYKKDEDEAEDEGAMDEGHGMTAYQDDEDDKMGDMDDDMMAMDDEKEEMPGDEGPEDAPMDDMDDMGDADEVEISEDDRAALAAAIPVLEKIAGGAGGDMDMDDMGVEDDPGMMDPVKEGHGMKADDEKLSMKEMDHAGKRDEKELDEVELVDENDLVQEVTRRVAARLRAAMKSRK